MWSPSSLPVSFDPDNLLTNDAHDAVLSRGRNPGKIPFHSEVKDEVATPLSKGVTATDGACPPVFASGLDLRAESPLRQGRVWISLFKNGSVFMLTHNDWFHRVPRIITKGFPLLNGNYKRQIESKQLTFWVKQLSPNAAVGGDAAKSRYVYWCCYPVKTLK